MERSALSHVVRSKIAEVLGTELAEITEDVDLAEEFHVDSLELMEIGSRLEYALGTRLTPDDLVTMRRVGDAVDLLHRSGAGAS